MNVRLIINAVGSNIDSLETLPGRGLNTTQEVGIKIATPAGVLLGQLLFGWLGDVLGRKRICASFSRMACGESLANVILYEDGMELMIIMVATFGQALCAPAIGVSVVGVLIFWRFVVRHP